MVFVRGLLGRGDDVGAAGRPVKAVVLMAVHVTSIASLAAQLKMRGEMLDAFGPTDDGELMRLAAATLTEFEAMFNKQMAELSAEVRRLETQIHHA